MFRSVFSLVQQGLRGFAGLSQAPALSLAWYDVGPSGFVDTRVREQPSALSAERASSNPMAEIMGQRDYLLFVNTLARDIAENPRDAALVLEALETTIVGSGHPYRYPEQAALIENSRMGLRDALEKTGLLNDAAMQSVDAYFKSCAREESDRSLPFRYRTV